MVTRTLRIYFLNLIHYICMCARFIFLESELKLDFKIKQAMLLPKQTINDYLQGIMILKEDNSIYVYPEYAKTVMLDITPNLYVHVAEADICQVNGYMFNYKVNVRKELLF